MHLSRKQTHRHREQTCVCQEEVGEGQIVSLGLVDSKYYVEDGEATKYYCIAQETIFLQRHTDGKQTHERMLNITHYQRNANQDHNQVPSHTSQNGCDPKVYKQQTLERVWRKGNPLTLFVGMQTSTATLENSVEIL